MTDILDAISVFGEDYFGITVPTIGWTDVLEIIIIAVFFYELLVWIKNTRAWMLFRGIVVILVFFGIAALLGMNTVVWLGSKLFNAGIIALVVVFQPELRSALEQLGRRDLFHSIVSIGIGRTITERFSNRTLTDMVKASFEMGAVKTGALIVVEKEVVLTEYERTGIPLDSILTRQLLINIFEKNTPLHDGAIIVRGNRVVSATCYLPLTDNMELSKDLGTRHRAAIGISEVSDALTIVVSEETGNVSIAQNGKLLGNVTPDELEQALKVLQQPELDEEHNAKEERRGIFKYFKPRKNAPEGEATQTDDAKSGKEADDVK